MSATKDFRKLKGRISGHTDANGRPLEGVVTRTGLLKTEAGLVIPPSTFKDQSSHTGPLVPLTAEEQALFPQEAEVKHVTAPSADAPAKPKPARRRTVAAKKPAEPVVAETVTVGIVLENAGKIPSQYVHVHRGNGVLVLGMCELSYEPQRLAVSNGAYSGVFELEQYPGERYGYTGNEFTDSNGVRNILAFRLPEPKEKTDGD